MMLLLCKTVIYVKSKIRLPFVDLVNLFLNLFWESVKKSDCFYYLRSIFNLGGEIVSEKFRMMKNGYDRFAVDDAISEYQSTISYLNIQNDLYLKEINRLKEEMKQLKEELADISLQVQTKESAYQEISRLAIKEANSVIGCASNNADVIVKEALTTARIIITELSTITSSTDLIKKDMIMKLNQLQQDIDDIMLPRLPDIRWIEAINKESDEQDK
ncbi:hypothetical protein EII25_06285 [Erysipelotrichaceae bacterium OH741_COT-311]|nr:hypothetical protein EII25_06285 [Erysipelotrichaceae bacterium OH741_COT-311]